MDMANAMQVMRLPNIGYLGGFGRKVVQKYQAIWIDKMLQHTKSRFFEQVWTAAEIFEF